MKCTSRAAMSKPSGGVRSFLAVRLGLANAGCCPCLYLQCCFSEVLLVQPVNFIFTAFASLCISLP